MGGSGERVEGQMEGGSDHTVCTSRQQQPCGSATVAAV